LNKTPVVTFRALHTPLLGSEKSVGKWRKVTNSRHMSTTTMTHLQMPLREQKVLSPPENLHSCAGHMHTFAPFSIATRHDILSTQDFQVCHRRTRMNSLSCSSFSTTLPAHYHLAHRLALLSWKSPHLSSSEMISRLRDGNSLTRVHGQGRSCKPSNFILAVSCAIRARYGTPTTSV
jgi:hypothetical protein